MKTIIMFVVSAIILTSCAVEKSNCCGKSTLRSGYARNTAGANHTFLAKKYNF